MKMYFPNNLKYLLRQSILYAQPSSQKNFFPVYSRILNATNVITTINLFVVYDSTNA